MRGLPSGTVTLLFTDIEGSTKLLHELDDEYAVALDDHRRVVRDAFSAHSGVEVDTQATPSSAPLRAPLMPSAQQRRSSASSHSARSASGSGCTPVSRSLPTRGMSGSMCT
jgi:class 3 adenylate cyclase